MFLDKYITIDVNLYDYQVYRISEGAVVPYGGTSFDGNIYIFAGYWDWRFRFQRHRPRDGAHDQAPFCAATPNCKRTWG